MICHHLRCIFVEVPKTGSTSVRAIVGDPDKPHMDIREIRAQADEAVFRGYFKFGFVRNPWDRTVSLYHRSEGIQKSGDMSFGQFVDWISLSSDTCIHPTPHRYQLDWFLGDDGRPATDFIGRFETLDNDWQYICRHLGINTPLPHLKRNPVARRHYTEYYNDRSRAIIGEKFRRDIEYFGYRFGR